MFRVWRMVCAALFGRFFIKHCKRAQPIRIKISKRDGLQKNQGGLQGFLKKVF
jgi:hypothetical protein